MFRPPTHYCLLVPLVISKSFVMSVKGELSPVKNAAWEIVVVKRCWNKTKMCKIKVEERLICSDLKCCGAGNTRKFALDSFWSWSLHLHLHLFYTFCFVIVFFFSIFFSAFHFNVFLVNLIEMQIGNEKETR